MLRFVFIFCAVSYFFVRSSFAADSLYFGTHQQFMSTRAIGMGNAGVAVANDENTLFYNPAGLYQLKDKKMNFFLKAGADPDITDFIDDIDKAGKDSQAIANVIEKNYGKNFSARAPSLGFLWARPDWSLAFIPADVSIDAALHRSVGPAINLYAIQDTTLAAAKSWKIRSVEYGHLEVGVTAKAIYRAQLDHIVDITAIQNDKFLEADDSDEGLTADFDLGFLWKLPPSDNRMMQVLKPTFGMVVRNVLDMGYFSNLGLYADEKNGKPEKLHRVIDVGSDFQLPSWWVFDSHFAFDVRDMLHPNFTIEKGIHAGLEFNWEMARWWKGGWRVGLNQMYWTAGFTGQIWAFKLDLATFGRELGTESNKLEDRVYMFTTSVDF